MVKLFKRKTLSKQRGIRESGTDHLTGIDTNNKTKIVPSQHHQLTWKIATADDNETQFTSIFDDPKMQKYQLMTTAAKKASFGQCFFARHRGSADVVMIMVIQNEFMNKFKDDFTDSSKLNSMMAAVDPNLNGLREMIGMSRSTALILDVDMTPPNAKKDDIVIIEDHTTIQQSSTASMAATATALTEAGDPAGDQTDNLGSWLSRWVICGSEPNNLLQCNAPIGAPTPTPTLTVIPECSDENIDTSNTKSYNSGSKPFGAIVKDRRVLGKVASRIVDVDDATTVATAKRISQQHKVRSRMSSSVYSRTDASTTCSRTLPSIFSMDSQSIPPEEDWFSMLDRLLTPDMR
ncbi:MAG: hypothetical protein SGBAC_005620 [Bacillariaceae sp.]